MIYVFTGPSGSGKTTIAKKVSERLGIPLIPSWTTRPIRPGEIEGVDNNFTTNEKFRQMNMIATFEVVCAEGDLWLYGINEDEINGDCIMVLTPSGVDDLVKDTMHPVTDFMIIVDDELRLKRVLDRNDNQSKEEIERRIQSDKKMFKDYKPLFTINNNHEVNYAIKSALDLINLIK